MNDLKTGTYVALLSHSGSCGKRGRLFVRTTVSWRNSAIGNAAEIVQSGMA
ncbi:MAG: hypothetical protein M2R45_05152 [Verrucomicrobia subdivision 3 bacterium]|nr:hypothetical protein [Limisphaerales bacterium]MCS1413795.1 hypothetical protein [Limisphaerales bacterium]